MERLDELELASIQGRVHSLQFAVAQADRHVNHLGDGKHLDLSEIQLEGREILEILLEHLPGLLGGAREGSRRQYGDVGLSVTSRNQFPPKAIEKTGYRLREIGNQGKGIYGDPLPTTSIHLPPV